MRNFAKVLIPTRAKQFIRNSVAEFKLRTSSSRVLPGLIIVGAQKSGTTSLYHYLSEHPQLSPSFAQETHYFDGGLNPSVDSYSKGEAWYRAHFPRQGSITQNMIAYEGTPLYLFNPLVPQRILDDLPEVKLIAILRNPVERAISHYFHEVRKGREDLPIMEALQQEEARLSPILKAQDYKNAIFINKSYKARGEYRTQLERYFSRFPRDRILVLDSAALFHDPANALIRIFRFLRVDPDYQVSNLKPRNIGTNRTKVDAEVYQYLEQHFQPLNEGLFSLLDEKFDW